MNSGDNYTELQTTQSTVFIVDDQTTSRIILENIAKTIDSNIEVKCFDNASDALLEAESSAPDLILTDYKMPNIDGVEFIERLRTNINCRDIPIVIITALDDKGALYKALEAGATDFLVKPVDPHECKVRCRNLLTMQRQRLVIKNHASSLEVKIKEATHQILLREMETLSRLARAGEFKGKISGRNLIRMGKFTSIIAEEIGFDKEKRELLEISSVMHDIGKIGIPDSILLKPGKLTWEEFEVMKKHPEIGEEILRPFQRSIFDTIRMIIRNHHERMDGMGYPDGLPADEIPIEVRIVSVADAYDAMTSTRPYREPFSVERAIEELNRYSGTQWDLEVVDVMCRLMDPAKI